MKALPHIKYSALIAGLTIAGATAYAQDETDALRYSFLQPQGTARSMGFGSALGSVGGDFSSLSVNPAGIGIYRRSEFMFTPAITFSNTNAGYQASPGYQGGAMDANGSHFAFNNVGIVWTTTAHGRRYDRTPWKAVSFGLGINRLADFTRDYTYTGTNTSSSGSFVFEDDANNGSLDVNSASTPAYLGYQSYLLDTFTFSNGPGYLSNINPSSANPVTQMTSVKERGGISEVVLTLGGNYQEHLMLGATIGLPVVNYRRDKTYTESNLAGASSNYLNYFTYTEGLRTSGLGINLKLGAIYKPNDYFRIGAAVHTPTYYGLTDVQDQSVESSGSFGNAFVPATQNQYDYNLTTPWRGILSATAMLGKYGFFTVDYEYVDYSSARFKFNGSASDKAYEQMVNNTIKSTYQGASNIRTGIEIKLDNLSLRGGFGYYGNPYKSGVYSNGEHLDFTGGIGYRFGNMFADLAYVHRTYKSTDQPYRLPSYYENPTVSNYVPVIANMTNAANTVALTVGWKF